MTDYHIFRRTPSTSEPFDPREEAPIATAPNGGVLSIKIEREGQELILIGYCYYWATENEFGCYNCDDHLEFGGPISYRWDSERFLRESNLPSEGVEILEGEWVPDEEWGA